MYMTGEMIVWTLVAAMAFGAGLGAMATLTGCFLSLKRAAKQAEPTIDKLIDARRRLDAIQTDHDALKRLLAENEQEMDHASK